MYTFKIYYTQYFEGNGFLVLNEKDLNDDKIHMVYFMLIIIDNK
jgi:hypothetical protein